MPPRVRLVVLFFAVILAGELVHWLWRWLRYVVAICLALWLGWLLVGNIAVM